MNAAAVLLVGGAGAFGQRLGDGIAATTTLPLIIAGRDLARAEREAARLRARYPAARVGTLALDRACASVDELRASGAAIVVDAAGPFQNGDARLAAAAIAAGVHYLDLADARGFVAGFSALDDAARTAGVVALTGASSTPALSNAALDALTAGWAAIDSVDIAIMPGNRAPRGRSVVEAILSYAGRPVRVFDGGVWRTARGWGLLQRRAVSGLGQRWLSLCEAPDLDIVAERFAVADRVLFRAGLELSVLHLGLWALTLPVRAGWTRSLVPLAGALHWIAERFARFGSDRGGMEVTATGRNAEGQAVCATWRLIAEAGDGPFVPTLPALAAIKAIAAGKIRWRGAAACVGVLDLTDIEAEMKRHRIVTSISVTPRATSRLFAETVPDYTRLPPAVQAAHAVDGVLTLRGRADVGGSRFWIARLLRAMLCFPQPAKGLPVRVRMEAVAAAEGRSGGEIWTRDFGGARFRSHLSRDGRSGIVRERFGPLSFHLAVTAAPDGLRMRMTGWSLGPLPLPRWLAPHSEAQEQVDGDGRFTFDVPVVLPLLGILVHYRGWLAPASGSRPPPAKIGHSSG